MVSKTRVKPLPIVVGIDVGHDCTKVAASVPQHVTYSNFDDAIGNDLPPKDDDALESFRWFKLDALSSAPDAEKKIWSDSKNTERPARELLRTFLQGLHQKIRQCVLRMYPGIDWNKEYIDFVFSIPSVVGLNGASNMMKLAKESDFDSASGRHKVVDIALTEPEAAGVHIVRQLSESTGLKKGHTALIIDAGGGTTDLSMMTLIDDDKWKLDTNFLQPVSSQQLGGAHIDLAILNLLGKFFLDHGCLPTDVHHLVNCVYTLPKFFTSKTKLETLECTCPQSPGVLFPPMPGHGDEIRVVNGKLTIEKCLFQRMLSQQIFGISGFDGIAAQAITMCDDLFVRRPGRSSHYIKERGIGNNKNGGQVCLDSVLFAGGLGRSETLQQQVEDAMREVRTS